MLSKTVLRVKQVKWLTRSLKCHGGNSALDIFSKAEVELPEGGVLTGEPWLARAFVISLCTFKRPQKCLTNSWDIFHTSRP